MNYIFQSFDYNAIKLRASVANANGSSTHYERDRDRKAQPNWS